MSETPEKQEYVVDDESTKKPAKKKRTAKTPTKKKVAVKSEAASVEETIPKLPKKNRTLRCILSGEEVIVHPARYEALYEKYGSEEEIGKNFLSKTSEVFKRENPILFSVQTNKLFKKMQKQFVDATARFNVSAKQPMDASKYHSELQNIAKECGFSKAGISTENGGVTSVNVAFPLIGEIQTPII